ncbi:Cardioacceleratory peptide receptor [Trachymyrmex zeteki]|uniref:Cardioacceleratory peptide receptor n=1 Tax=Mycetomoellerius zeteki TaxID=64791 RepID=A0A151X8G1_9HYME|nr:Cardioacceleratory peptide receptor [Trachymyrmex zeteki]
MQAVVTYSSTYVLVALSIDRYDAITRPMNFSGSWWRARALVITAWALSALFSMPIVFLYEEKQIQDTPQCWIDLDPTQWKIYMSLVSFSLFIAPTLIIGGCYTVIVVTIWSQGAALRQGPTRDTRRASSRGLIPKAKIKTVKMTFVIVFVFILCWSPYIVFDLLQVYGHIRKTQTNIAVATFIQSLTPLNSAANPIIYCLFSTPFCKTVRILRLIAYCLLLLLCAFTLKLSNALNFINSKQRPQRWQRFPSNFSPRNFSVKQQLLLGRNMQAISWISGWCPTNSQHCFGTGTTTSSTRTTVTTSLTAHSSRRSGHFTMLHSTSRKRVMVSLV